MAVISLSAITGTDIPSLINALERQRKELEFILTSLDNDNMIEISGDLINDGIVKSEYVESGAGNDLIEADVEALQTEVFTNIPISIGSLETEVFTNIPINIGSLETEVFTNIPISIGSLETEVFTNIPQDIADARIIESVASDPVDAVVGQIWLRSDL